MTNPRAKPRPGLVLLSLIATPWWVFLSTANVLFLDNQADLGYNLRAYLPFAALALTGMVGGLAVFFLAGRFSIFRPLLTAYYGFGPGFLLFFNLRRLGGLPEGVLLGGLGLIFGAILFLSRRFDPARSIRVWALLAVVFGAMDTAAFVSRYALLFEDGSRAAAAREPSDELIRPNIYHLLFDGYQSDVFALTLTPEIEHDLRGFRIFPRNTTSWGRTRASIPSVFLGKAWDPRVALDQFTSDAFHSDGSLLHALSESGYETTAYLHRRFSFSPNLFNRVLYHHAFHHHPMVRQQLARSNAFHVLWLYKCTPRFIARRRLGEELMERIESGRFAPKTYTTGSYATFEHFLKAEEKLAASNRYTFVHLILPHYPYLLNRDCERQKNVGALEQFRCASSMIARFIRELKWLDRFEDSLIVVQADHGLNFQIDGGSLTAVEFNKSGVDWNAPRSKALLLLKPAGRDDGEALRVSRTPTSLLDIAPTILRSIGVDPDPRQEGTSLLPMPRTPESRKRYYHYYPGDLTAEVYRFVIEGDRFEFDTFLQGEPSTR